MNDHASSATGESKWVELIHAIEASLVGAAEGINFGLELFPYDPAGISPGAYDPAVLCNVPNGQGAIAVDIAPGQGNVAHITDILSGQYPAGATPTANALQQAYNYYTQGDGKNLNGSKWVLLVTDGARC